MIGATLAPFDSSFLPWYLGNNSFLLHFCFVVRFSTCSHCYYVPFFPTPFMCDWICLELNSSLAACNQFLSVLTELWCHTTTSSSSSCIVYYHHHCYCYCYKHKYSSTIWHSVRITIWVTDWIFACRHLLPLKVAVGRMRTGITDMFTATCFACVCYTFALQLHWCSWLVYPRPGIQTIKFCIVYLFMVLSINHLMCTFPPAHSSFANRVIKERLFDKQTFVTDPRDSTLLIPLDCVMSQFSPVLVLITYFCEIHFFYHPISFFLSRLM
jgi:hypothetical protein